MLIDIFFHISFLTFLFSFFCTGFEVPDLNLAKQLVVDGFIVSMVSYTVSVSMALIFAQKLAYEIDFNQELLAMGASNLVGSFFSCLPLSASLSRSIIQQSTGGRTQIASVISCGILTFVLLWIGPFFELLPRVCCHQIGAFIKFIIVFVVCCLFSVCFGQHYSGCIERDADASKAIFPILANVTFRRCRVARYIFERCHFFN